ARTSGFASCWPQVPGRAAPRPSRAMTVAPSVQQFRIVCSQVESGGPADNANSLPRHWQKQGPGPAPEAPARGLAAPPSVAEQGSLAELHVTGAAVIVDLDGGGLDVVDVFRLDGGHQLLGGVARPFRQLDPLGQLRLALDLVVRLRDGHLGDGGPP